MNFGALELPISTIDVFGVFPNRSSRASHQVIRISTGNARRRRDVVVYTPKALKIRMNRICSRKTIEYLDGRYGVQITQISLILSSCCARNGPRYGLDTVDGKRKVRVVFNLLVKPKSPLRIQRNAL